MNVLFNLPNWFETWHTYTPESRIDNCFKFNFITFLIRPYSSSLIILPFLSHVIWGGGMPRDEQSNCTCVFSNCSNDVIISLSSWSKTGLSNRKKKEN